MFRDTAQSVAAAACITAAILTKHNWNRKKSCMLRRTRVSIFLFVIIFLLARFSIWFQVDHIYYHTQFQCAAMYYYCLFRLSICFDFLVFLTCHMCSSMQVHIRSNYVISNIYSVCIYSVCLSTNKQDNNK